MASPKKKVDLFQPSGETRRVQPLNKGRHVRIFDHLGKSHHLPTSGLVEIAALLEGVRDDSPEMFERIRTELADMGVTLPEVVDVTTVESE
jgi:hypothetical protein